MTLSIRQKVAGFLVMLLMILASGCGIGVPRPRMGTLPTPPPGPRFLDPENLGKHSYGFNPFEKNGIVYTSKAGHIDVTHLRWNADYTRYATNETYKALMKNKKGFSFVLALERSVHHVEFSYPADWKGLSKKYKEKIASDISYEVGPYLAYNATLWHEIITWYGTKFAGFEPEFNSAFSWEDMFSNLLGTRLAVVAMRSEEGYNKGMTKAINKELKKLDVMSRSKAIYAAEKMRGKWYTGVLSVDTKRRNMDVGFDGYITPILVPGVGRYRNQRPVSYPVPNIDILDKYGISLKYEIEPNIWEEGKIFSVANNPGDSKGKLKRIIPSKHYPIIMRHIRKEAVEKFGYDIDY